MNQATPSKRRRAIVHIGMHKTGTTAIQRFVKRNPEAVARAGLYWPGEFPPNARHAEAHHYIPWILMGRQQVLTNCGYDSLFVDATMQRLEACPVDSALLISSENFDLFNSAQIDELMRLLDNFDISIILYVRRQDEFLQANYQTDVVHFKKRTSISGELNDPRLDYLALASRWAEVVGKGNIHVRAYEKTQLLDGNAVADFLAVLKTLGHVIEARIPGNRVNVGLPSDYVELIRRLVADGVVPQDIWQRADWVGQKIYSGGAGQYWFLSPSQRRALLDKFRDGNAELAQTYLDRPDGNLFNDLSVPWDDESWQLLYGSTNALLNNFLFKVGKRLEKIP